MGYHSKFAINECWILLKPRLKPRSTKRKLEGCVLSIHDVVKLRIANMMRTISQKAKFGGASTPGRSASRPTTPGASTSRYAHTPGPATADRKRGAPMQTPSTIGTGKRTRLAATASLPVPRHAATTYGSPLPRGNTNLSRSCSDPAPLPALGISTAHNARSASHQHAIPVSKLASVLGKSEGRRPRRQSFKPRQSLIGPTTPGGGYAPDASLIMEEEF